MRMLIVLFILLISCSQKTNKQIDTRFYVMSLDEGYVILNNFDYSLKKIEEKNEGNMHFYVFHYFQRRN